jgi:hypothetical protein
MEAALVTIPLDEYQQLIEAIREISKLRAEISQIREDNRSLREDLKKAKVFTTALRVDDLFEAIDEIDQRLGPKELGPRKKDRGEILRALLASNGSMLASMARKKMHLSKSQFSQLLNSVEDYVDVKPYHLDHRQNVLRLKNKKP